MEIKAVMMPLGYDLVGLLFIQDGHWQTYDHVLQDEGVHRYTCIMYMSLLLSRLGAI